MFCLFIEVPSWRRCCVYTGKTEAAQKGRWENVSWPFCSEPHPPCWWVFIKTFWAQLSVGTHTYTPSIWEDETGEWPEVQGQPSHILSSSLTWATKWDPAPSPKKAFCACKILYVHIVSSLWPRRLSPQMAICYTHCFAFLYLEICTREHSILVQTNLPIPFKSCVVLDYMM